LATPPRPVAGPPPGAPAARLRFETRPPRVLGAGGLRRWGGGAAGRPGGFGGFATAPRPAHPLPPRLGDLLRLRHGTSDDEFPVAHDAGVLISPVAAMAA